MTDPVTLAVTAASKSFGTAAAKQILPAGPRLGGREERRAVYQRFADANVRWMMLNQRLAALRQQPWSAFHPFQWARLPEQLIDSQTELLIAYQELLLVASPQVLEVGERALSASVPLVLAANDRRRTVEFQELSTRQAAEVRQFTLACRVDLSYEPRRWQVWRPRLWAGRRAARKALKTAARRELPPGS